MGATARSDKTDKAIREALLEEIHEKPIDEVSVSAICKRAGVNRSTFYRRYESPAALLEIMRQEYLDKLHDLNASNKGAGEIDIHVRGLSLIKEQMGVIHSLQGPNSDEGFLRKVINDGFGASANTLRASNPELTPREADLMYFFIAGGTMQIIIKWVEDGMKDSIPDMAEFMTKMIYRCAHGSDVPEKTTAAEDAGVKKARSAKPANERPLKM